MRSLLVLVLNGPNPRAARKKSWSEIGGSSYKIFYFAPHCKFFLKIKQN